MLDTIRCIAQSIPSWMTSYEIHALYCMSTSIDVIGDNIKSAVSIDEQMSIRYIDNGVRCFFSTSNISDFNVHDIIRAMPSRRRSSIDGALYFPKADDEGIYFDRYRDTCSRASLKYKHSWIRKIANAISSAYNNDMNYHYNDCRRMVSILNSNGMERCLKSDDINVYIDILLADGLLFSEHFKIDDLSNPSGHDMIGAIDAVNNYEIRRWRGKDAFITDILISPYIGSLLLCVFINHIMSTPTCYPVGTAVSSNLVNIVDEPKIDIMQYRPFDDEGTLSGRTTLIKDGVITNFLHDYNSAHLCNCTPQGNAYKLHADERPTITATNMSIVTSSDSHCFIDAIPRDALYALSIPHGYIDFNYWTGEFVAPLVVRYEQMGSFYITYDLCAKGNIVDIFKSITAHGSIVKWYKNGWYSGCYGSPSLLLEDVHIRCMH